MRYLLIFQLLICVLGQGAEVENITELKNLNVASGLNVFVKGRTVANDGGGGIFFWHEASTFAEDGGTIFTSNLSSTGRWIREYSGLANVLWFGAKGDGAEDDTSAIQAAVNAASGGVLFPAGIYRVTNVEINSDLQIVGHSAIIQASDVRTNIVYIRGSNSSITGLRILGVENASTWDSTLAQTRSGLEIGTGADNVTVVDVMANEFSTGFVLSTNSGAKIINCTATNTWLTSSLTEYHNSSGVQVRGSCGSLIEGWKSHGYGQGILSVSESQGGKIIGATIQNTIDNGIYLSTSDGWVVSGIRVTNIGQVGVKARGSMNKLSDIVAVNCTTIGIDITPSPKLPVEGSYEYFYSTNRGLPTNYWYNGRGNSLVGFYVENTGSGGVRLGSTANGNNRIYQHDSIISSGMMQNVATNAPYSAIVCYGDGHILRDLILSGWNDDARAYALVITAPAGVSFRRVQVSGLSISSPTTRNRTGIFLGGLKNGAVRDNLVFDARDSIVLWACDGLRLDNNFCDGNLRLKSVASTNIIAGGNYFSGSVEITGSAAQPVSPKFRGNYASSWPLGFMGWEEN